MPFDGVDWDSPVLGSTFAAYPGAPLTAEAMGCALVSSYFAARRNGRLFAQPAFARQERSAQDGGPGKWIMSPTPVVVGGARGWVDGTWTHATAFVVFEVVASLDVEMHLRVRATDAAATTVVGTETVLPVEATASQRNGDLFAPLEPIGTYEDSLVVMSADVSLSGLALSARVRIDAEGCAGVALVPGYTRPRWVALYLECRG